MRLSHHACSVRSKLTPFRLERTMRVEDDRLVLDETVRNEGDDVAHFVWGHHLVLGPHAGDHGQAVAREPHREPDVDRALVGTDTDAREQPRVAAGVVAVEVVGLAPGGVALHRVSEVVLLVEDRHGPRS